MTLCSLPWLTLVPKNLFLVPGCRVHVSGGHRRVDYVFHPQHLSRASRGGEPLTVPNPLLTTRTTLSWRIAASFDNVEIKVVKFWTTITQLYESKFLPHPCQHIVQMFE